MRALILLLLLFPSRVSAQRLLEPREGLTEVSREIEVELRHGLALVSTRITITNGAPEPAEARIRVSVPATLGLASLRVCSGGFCRDGTPDVNGGSYDTARAGIRFSRRPFATAGLFRTWRDRSIIIQAAPVVNTHPYEITVRYVAPAPLPQGSVHFELPAQGGGELDGPISVTVSAPDLDGATVDGASGRVMVSAASSVVVRAHLPSGVTRTYGWSVRCGDDRCTRFRVAAGPVPVRARDVFVLLDASPSARHVPGEHRQHILSTLLGALHPDSRVVRVMFGRRALRLDARPLPPDAVPTDEPLTYLGNRTSFDRAWALIRQDVRRATDPLVVLVGDGALSTDAQTRAALRQAADAGAEISVVSIAERHVESVLAAAVADTTGSIVTALEESADPAVRLITAPVVEANVRLYGQPSFVLRAGEERVFETRRQGGGPTPELRAFGRTVVAVAPRQLWADGLATRLAPGDPRAFLAATSLAQRDAAREHHRAARGGGFGLRTRRRRIAPTCGGYIACGCRARGSISAETLRIMQSRLRPAVTTCFSIVRAGRPAWSGSATLLIVLRYGELLSATVPQASDPALTSCISRVADEYGDIPYSDSVTAVRIPFRSNSIEAPLAEAISPTLRRVLTEIGIR